MADVRISALPAAQSPITGSELVPVVQNGLTVQTTVAAITQSPSLTQTFLTVGQQPLLPNSRYFSTGVGLGFTDGGAQGAYSIALNGASASLEGASTGFPVKTSPTTIAARSLTTSGNGLSVTNGDGVAGNPVFQLTGLAAAIANATGTGILGLNGSLLTPLEVVGTVDQINVLDGNGAAGNPTLSLADNTVIPGNAGVVVPSGSTAQRGATVAQIRYNTDTSRFEGLYGSGWQPFGIGDGTVTSVSGTPNEITVSNVGSIATVGLSTNPVVPGTAAIQVPSGTTGQRPSGVNGQIRYNTSTGTFEGYANGAWGAIVSGTGVTSVATGTGLTGGPITTTGTISIANTGVTAASYGSASTVPVLAVNAQGQITSASNATIAIPSSAITDKGLPNGVASLDAGGTVPTSQLPAAVLGALKYQGAWNASTNTPTLTSSTGTQGYYYVVSVAGTTNLDGITDWQVGDWAIFNGSVWQKIDNTDAVTSVNGYTGAVNLTYSDVGAFPATATTGTGNVVLQNNPSISAPTIDGANPYIQFNNGSAVTVAAGKLWYDGSTGSFNAGMGGGNITQQIGEELFRYGKASSAITDSPLQIVYKTGVVGASGVITFAPTVAGITDSDLIIGVATEPIALNGFGRVTTYGIVNNINTTGSAYGETWLDGDDIWYNPVTGNPTKTKPSAPNIKLQIGTVINAGAGSGSFIVKLGSSSSLGGTDSNVQLGTLSNADLLQYDSTAQYWKNVAPSTVAVTSVSFGTTGLTPATGTKGDVTVAGTLVAANGGTGQSSYTIGDLLYASGTSALSKLGVGSNGYILTVNAGVPSWQPAPATGVTSFSAGTTGLTPNTATTGAVTLAGTLAIANGGTNGSATPTAGTVAYGTGTAYAFTAAGTAGQVLTSNGSGAPTWVTPAGGVTLANDTSTATNLYPTFASATTGSVSTIYTGNAKLLYKPSTGEFQSTVLNATNGIVVNSATISADYTIPSGSNAMSAGPVTVASGVTVTVSSGSVWAIV